MSGPIALFKEAPQSQKEANEIAMKYCKKKDTQELFDTLFDMKRVKKGDLQEAIFDFEHGQYKSCALLLFSIIDAMLIRMQREEDRKKRNRLRPSGIAAAKNILSRVKQENTDEETFYHIVYFENLFVCFETMFARGNDFVEQPNVINRNFLDHGMMIGKVRRRDCIQLFMLYFNFLQFLEEKLG
jgi:hypothetical protein